MDLLEALLLLESKQDIENFIDKFGQDTYDLFLKSKDRLKNNKLSTDLTWHTKNTSPEEMDNMLSSLQQKMGNSDKSEVDFSKKQIPGKYKYFGRMGNYDVYQPLDYISSMALGINTSWCTTGRYGGEGGYGNPNYKPSAVAAEEHFNNYTSMGIKFYYLLDPKTNYGEIAVSKYKEPFDVGYDKSNDSAILRRTTNFRIFNAEDTSDYSLVDNLPTGFADRFGLVFNEKTVATVDPNDKGHYIIQSGEKRVVAGLFEDCKFLTSVTIPDSVEVIGDWAFYDCKQLTDIGVIKNVKVIGEFAFAYCENLKNVILPEGLSRINEGAFICCESLEKISIPDSVEYIGKSAFAGCKSLKEVRYNYPTLSRITSKDDNLELFLAFEQTLSYDASKKIKKEYIKDITLLSLDGAKSLSNKTRTVGHSWWLRTPSGKYWVYCVEPNGDIAREQVQNWLFLRPALICSENIYDLGIDIGDIVSVLGEFWECVKPNMLLMQGVFATPQPFSELGPDGTSNYDTSGIKRRLDDWLRLKMSKE